jgi:DNA-binding response OmpR family regulator
MRGRILLIHWRRLEAVEIAKPLRAKGWTVEIESRDGARAYRIFRTKPPDLVLIYLSRLTSHGRETGHALRSLKTARPVPIVFIDGEGVPLRQTKAKVPGGVFLTSADLDQWLEGFRPATDHPT